MQVLSYSSANAPAKMSWLAKIVTSDGVHPVYFFATTEADVIEKATTWWNEQLSKVDKRRGPKKAKVAATVDNSEEAI